MIKHTSFSDEYDQITKLVCLENSKPEIVFSVFTYPPTNYLVLFDSLRLRPLRRTNRHTGKLHEIIVLKNGKIMTAVGNHFIKVWDYFTGAYVTIAQSIFKDYAPLLELSDEKFVSVSSGNQIEFWKKGSRFKEALVFQTITQNACLCMILLSDNLIACGNGNSISIYPTNGSLFSAKYLKGHCSLVANLLLVKEQNKLLSVTVDSQVRVWDLKNNCCIQTITNANKIPKENTVKEYNSIFNLGISALIIVGYGSSLISFNSTKEEKKAKYIETVSKVAHISGLNTRSDGLIFLILNEIWPKSTKITIWG